MKVFNEKCANYINTRIIFQTFKKTPKMKLHSSKKIE